MALALLLILAALLSAGLARVQRGVRAAVCANHLRQWIGAAHLYAADHDDFMPPEGSPNGLSRQAAWYVELADILGAGSYHQMAWRTNARASPSGSVWACPANTNRSNGLNLFHFCVNARLDGTGDADRPLRVSSIPAPSLAVWMFDNGRRAAVAQQNNVHTNAHSGGAQFSFADGHVDRFRATHYWDFDRAAGRTDHPELRWSP